MCPLLVLVEDNEMLRDVMKERFIQKGFDVMAFETAEAALNRMPLQTNLVITDNNLGLGMKGTVLTEEIKKTRSGVAVFMFSSDDVEGEFYKAGGNKFFNKEDTRGLTKAVCDWFGCRSCGRVLEDGEAPLCVKCEKLQKEYEDDRRASNEEKDEVSSDV